MVDCGRLTDDCQITSGTDRNVMANHLISKVFGIFFFQSETVILLLLVPVLQTDYQVNVLGILKVEDAAVLADTSGFAPGCVCAANL